MSSREASEKSVDQPSHDVSNVSFDSSQDEGWEVYTRKPKNRAGSSAATRPQAWGPQISNTTIRPWGHSNLDASQKRSNGGGGIGRASGSTWTTNIAPDYRRSAPATGRGNPWASQPAIRAPAVDIVYRCPPPIIPSALEHGFNWSSIVSSTSTPASGATNDHNGVDLIPSSQSVHKYVNEEDDIADEVDEVADDVSDDDVLSDDSCSSQMSHETKKQSKWFKDFFKMMDELTLEEINEPARQWHCPACQSGPGAIDWFRGLQPLMTHAKTKGSKRVKLHRELAELLDEELHMRGTSAFPAGEAFGLWKGLTETIKDHDIVWPPMVMIMNTTLEKDDDEKWIGMGNQELLEYFSAYPAVKARHSYGPKGHRGMSVLIFQANAVGYHDAERLHKHFLEQGTHRDAWERRRVLFSAGGKRQLYGYMALKEDLDLFNLHSQGKAKLKYEIRSYHEMVVSQMKQMSQENEQLNWYKDRVSKEQRHSKTVEESLGILSEKLRKTQEENRIVKQRTKMQHDQNREQMDFQEEFFREQIKSINDDIDVKESNFEKLHQEERHRVKMSNANESSEEDYRQRADEIAKLIKFQDEEVARFHAERDVLIKDHEEKVRAISERHGQENVALEKEFETLLTRLMDKYSPNKLKG
ncbi:Zinc finger-XS domain [Dillenia turbinata]|uniref:Zinc finger-XS domain n=1 Tax=Dillenia turbinata TaxID=194707 RepID=A0AAN8V980_9MAGN